MNESFRIKLVKSDCYLYWCLIQMLSLGIALIYLIIESRSIWNQELFFKIEASFYVLMIIDFFVYLFLYEWKVTPILIIEIFLIFIMGFFLFVIGFGYQKAWIEEYELVIMFIRTLLQFLRLVLLTVKTYQSKGRRDAMMPNFNLESGSQVITGPKGTQNNKLNGKFFISK